MVEGRELMVAELESPYNAELLVRDHILRGQEMVLKEYDRQQQD